MVFVERVRGMGFCLVSNERVREYDGFEVSERGYERVFGFERLGSF